MAFRPSSELTLTGLSAIGGRARGTGVTFVEAVRFIGSCARAIGSMPRSVRRMFGRVLMLQVRFTAVDAMPIIFGLALLIGTLVIAQAHATARK